jgi:long-chain acyl-CoA synthetase
MTNYLDILAETIRTNWDQPALTDFYLTEDGSSQDTSRGNHYTYGEMYAEICRVAELLTSLGLQKGDHIAICGANSAHWVIAYLAIAKMLGVSVTVMHTLMPDEIARLVDFSDAKALFTDADIWGELKNQSLPQVESVIFYEGSREQKGSEKHEKRNPS